MNWTTALTKFLSFLKIERGLAQNTIKSYELDLKKLIRFLEEYETPIPMPSEITTTTLQAFIYYEHKKSNTRTQARLTSSLKSFFKYLIFEKHREDQPMSLIESPKIGRKLPHILSIKEIDQILQHIDLSDPLGYRNYTIIELLYSCGLRVSELTTLKISDLYFKENFISVWGKGNKKRLIPIAKSTQEIVNNYIKLYRSKIKCHPDFSDHVFLNRRGKALTRAMIFTIVKKQGELSGLSQKISPHIFRHSFASHLLQNGADLFAIQQMLGHESIATTEIYTHVDTQFLEKTLKKHHPRNELRD